MCEYNERERQRQSRERLTRPSGQINLTEESAAKIRKLAESYLDKRSKKRHEDLRLRKMLDNGPYAQPGYEYQSMEDEGPF